MRRLPACLLLDLDGVVAQTEALSREAFVATYRDHTVSLSEQDLEAIVGLSFHGVDALMRERHHVPLPPDELLADYRARYITLLEQGLEPNPGLRELLVSAREQSVPVAVPPRRRATRSSLCSHSPVRRRTWTWSPRDRRS